MSHNRRTASGKTDSARRVWRVAALLTLALAAPAEAQALKTVRVQRGAAILDGGLHRVTGGFVDPRTGQGRVEVRGRRAVRLRRVRAVRTRGLITRVALRDGSRLRLRLAQLLFESGSVTLTLDAATFGEPKPGTFRLTGGRLHARTLRGSLATTGLIDLGPVQIRDLGVRPQEAVSAQVGDVRPDVGLLGPTPKARIERLTATLGPLDATLTRDAADGLNFYFHTDRFREGMPLGTLAVRGRLRG